jgi:NADH:ubiquinone oxidoreductase subunit 6 (subunit J)
MNLTMPPLLFLDATRSAPAGNLGALVLPAAVGLIGIYLLLPRPRSYSPWWGAILAVVALVAAGFLLVQAGGAVVETILFFAFSAVALVAGGLLITQQNPVRAALSFAMVVLSTCGLFLLQAAPFLMAATVIIYAGAIIVTFLFVIMLAQQAGLSDADARSREPFFTCLAGFLFLGAILLVLHTTYSTKDLDDLLQSTEQAVQQPSAEGMQAVLGEKRNFFERFQRLAESEPVSSESSRQLRAALNEVESEWKDRGGDAEKLKQALAKLYHAGFRVRNHQGTVLPPAQLPLSPYSRQMTGTPNPQSKDTESLPSENVVSVGRSLFTDYLLPVELGGTLLLVATIGAIAIAARRAEGLR